MRRDQNINRAFGILTGVWEELIPTLTDDFEAFKIPVGEASADMVETAQGLEFKLEHEDGTECLQFHD